jgi:hypothetical protein
MSRGIQQNQIQQRPATALPFTTRTARSLADIAAAIALVVFGAWAIAHGLMWFINWTAADVMLDPPVQLTAAAQPAPVAATCRPPSEHELLMITVTLDEGGNAQAGCKYISPRGAYHRSRSGMPPPRP